MSDCSKKIPQVNNSESSFPKYTQVTICLASRVFVFISLLQDCLDATNKLVVKFFYSGSDRGPSSERENLCPKGKWFALRKELCPKSKWGKFRYHIYSWFLNNLKVYWYCIILHLRCPLVFVYCINSTLPKCLVGDILLTNMRTPKKICVYSRLDQRTKILQR